MRAAARTHCDVNKGAHGAALSRSPPLQDKLSLPALLGINRGPSRSALTYISVIALQCCVSAGARCPAVRTADALTSVALASALNPAWALPPAAALDLPSGSCAAAAASTAAASLRACQGLRERACTSARSWSKLQAQGAHRVE